jgi:chromosome segregation ATPase
VEQQLEQAVERERDLRWNTWKRQEALTQRLQKNIDETEKALKKQRKEVEKALEKARDDLKEARKKLQNKAVELERAEAEFDRVTENQGDTIQPKLLVIAEAQVSGYINLKKLRISQGLFEDSLAVLLPEAEIDSVIFQLDSAQLYPLARPGSERTEEGAYYDIFQQIKNAIIQAEGRVKKRAIEAGIKAETRRLAEDYVRDFAANLNLGVVFVDSIPQLAVDSTIQILPFTADQVPDSLLNQLDTLQDSMVRSRSLLMEEGDQ